MSTQSSEKLLRDMMRQYCDDRSSVYPDMEKLREVLTQLSDQQKLHILEHGYQYSGWTRPLHCAARGDQTYIISTLLTSLQSSADRLKLLMVDTNTPLHAATLWGHTESVKMILDCLTADQQIQLMSAQDYEGETAIQLAERYRNTDTQRVLREYRHRAEQIQLQQEEEEEKRRLYQYRKSLSGKVI